MSLNNDDTDPHAFARLIDSILPTPPRNNPFWERAFRHLIKGLENGTNESASNGELVVLLRAAMVPVSSYKLPGRPEDEGDAVVDPIDLYDLTTDLDLFKCAARSGYNSSPSTTVALTCPLDSTAYCDAEAQRSAHDFRQSAGTLKTPASSRPASTYATSAATQTDGIRRPDIVLIAYECGSTPASMPPPRKKKRTTGADSASNAPAATSSSGNNPSPAAQIRTACVTLVGENKVSRSQVPDAEACQAFAQLFLQLSSARSAFGTCLGNVLINTRYARVLALGPREFAVEVKGDDHTDEAPSEVESSDPQTPPQTVPCKAEQFLSGGKLFNTLPHTLRSDGSGLQPLWDLVVAGYRLLTPLKLTEMGRIPGISKDDDDSVFSDVYRAIGQSRTSHVHVHGEGGGPDGAPDLERQLHAAVGFQKRGKTLDYFDRTYGTSYGKAAKVAAKAGASNNPAPGDDEPPSDKGPGSGAPGQDGRGSGDSSHNPPGAGGDGGGGGGADPSGPSERAPVPEASDTAPVDVDDLIAFGQDAFDDPEFNVRVIAALDFMVAPVSPAVFDTMLAERVAVATDQLQHGRTSLGLGAPVSISPVASRATSGSTSGGSDSSLSTTTTVFSEPAHQPDKLATTNPACNVESVRPAPYT